MEALSDEQAKIDQYAENMRELERLVDKDPWLIRRYLMELGARNEYSANMRAFREEGREEERKDIARKLRSQGILSDEQIESLGVPIEVVKSLYDVSEDDDLEDDDSEYDDSEDDDHMNALVEEAAKRNPDVAEMLDLEREFMSNPSLMREYWIAENKYKKYNADMNASIQEGRAEELKDMVRKLRSQGILSDEQIADALNMPIEVIKSL